MWITFGWRLHGWLTPQRWANQVFTSFHVLMGICEVNAYLVMKASSQSLGQKLPLLLCFGQKEAVKSLIDNPYCLCAWDDEGYEEVKEWRTREDLGHKHHTALVFMKHWTGKSWDTSRQAKHNISSQQPATIVAKTPGCRTYCSCNRDGECAKHVR